MRHRDYFHNDNDDDDHIRHKIVMSTFLKLLLIPNEMNSEADKHSNQSSS